MLSGRRVSSVTDSAVDGIGSGKPPQCVPSQVVPSFCIAPQTVGGAMLLCSAPQTEQVQVLFFTVSSNDIPGPSARMV